MTAYVLLLAFLGGFFGLMMAGLLVAASRESRREEKHYRRQRLEARSPDHPVFRSIDGGRR